jgi:LemA protein
MLTSILSVLIYLFIIVIFILIYLWSSYNQLIKKKNQVKTDFSDITIQLKRKADLVDRLVDLTKDYATHEKGTFEGVAKARTTLNSSKGIVETVKAENALSQTLRSLLMVVEENPKLQANENFLALREDLKSIENLIAEYREGYNRTVQDYNNTVQTFPKLLVANLFHFYPEELFALSE